MTPAAQVQEIREHYRRKGWIGNALNQRLIKHARLLAPHDRAVSEALWRSVRARTGGGWPR